MGLPDYKDLVTWQKAMDLVVQVYDASRRFPRDEVFALTSQIRRAAVSIPSNIVEGQGRGIGAEFMRYLRIANGSRQEVETQLLIAERLGYLDAESISVPMASLEETGRLVVALMRSIKS